MRDWATAGRRAGTPSRMAPLATRQAAAGLALVGAAVLLGVAGAAWPDGDRSAPSARLRSGIGSAPGSPPPTTGEPGAPVTTPSPGSFTLVAAGDVLVHPDLWEQAAADAAASGAAGRDFRPLLSGVRPLVEGADLAVCHLETPVAGNGEEPSGYPSFSVPTEIVPALADTGFDALHHGVKPHVRRRRGGRRPDPGRPRRRRARPRRVRPHPGGGSLPHRRPRGRARRRPAVVHVRLQRRPLASRRDVALEPHRRGAHPRRRRRSPGRGGRRGGRRPALG